MNLHLFNRKLDGSFPHQRNPLEGIAGWLILPTIGLILQILIIVQWMATDSLADFFFPDWRGMPTPFRPSFILCGYDVLMLVLCATVGVLFFRHRRSVPKLMVILCIGVLARVVLIIAHQLIGDEYAIIHRIEGGRMFDVFLTQVYEGVWGHGWDADILINQTLMLAAGIGIPYFLMSKRVRATFVK
jgi:hypothetical protein